MLVGMYPKVTAAEPEFFLTQLVALFGRYRSEELSAILDPSSGIAAKFKFLPSLAEIKAELDGVRDHFDRLKRFESWGSRAALPPPEVSTEQREANAQRLRDLSAKLAASVSMDRVPATKRPLPTDAELIPSDELVAIVRAKMSQMESSE